MNIEELLQQHPELLSYIDQQRTQASQTAYNNALKKLENDTDFVGRIRSQIEEEARMSGEEKLKLEREKLENDRKSLLLDRNKLTATNLLGSKGIVGEQAEAFIPFLVSENSEVTQTNVNNFLNHYTNVLDNQVSDMRKQLLHDGFKPNNNGGNDETNTSRLRAEYENARKLNRQHDMARIIREANELKITL